MPLQIIKGDIFTSKADYLVCPVNCEGVKVFQDCENLIELYEPINQVMNKEEITLTVNIDCTFEDIKFVCKYANTDDICHIDFDMLYGRLGFYKLNWQPVYEIYHEDVLIFNDNGFSIKPHIT